MNPSYIITGGKLQLPDIEEDKCNHEYHIYNFEKKISEENENIIQISYTCLKCNVGVVAKWKKIGRFYIKNEL